VAARTGSVPPLTELTKEPRVLAAFDVDGTIDADPPLFLSLMQALRAAGHSVVVLTGAGTDKVAPDDIAQKKEYLQSLGCADAYDKLVVFAAPPAEAKAAWIKNNGVDVLFDNNRGNAQAASQYCTVLLPWASRTGNKNNAVDGES
jgi:hypothetical protein